MDRKIDRERWKISSNKIIICHNVCEWHKCATLSGFWRKKNQNHDDNANHKYKLKRLSYCQMLIQNIAPGWLQFDATIKFEIQFSLVFYAVSSVHDIQYPISIKWQLPYVYCICTHIFPHPMRKVSSLWKAMYAYSKYLPGSEASKWQTPLQQRQPFVLRAVSPSFRYL